MPGHRRLRVAQVSPLDESVPPHTYGGTERVVATLTDELARSGHSVTLFASGDSETLAELVSPCTRALRQSTNCDPLSSHLLMVEMVAKRASEFDVIHFHIAPLHFSVARRLDTPHVTTLHGRLDLLPTKPVFMEFAELPFVSVSDAQREPLKSQNWIGTVHHGVPDDLTFGAGPGSYLAFLGRISREKRVDRAIAIAKACGSPLKIAAKVDPVDLLYFKSEIEPLLSDPSIEFVGEIGQREKNAFLGQARALLFPIDWPEPFGLVMIEALACGTPVVAFRGGSVTEVSRDGVTGFIVDDLTQAIDATQRIGTIERTACRQDFERRFTAGRMTDAYLRIYDRLAAEPTDVTP